MAGANKDASMSSRPTEEQVEQLTAPTAMRKLVLNYLIHHCYIDTARAFADDGISSTSYLAGSVDDTTAMLKNGNGSNGHAASAAASTSTNGSRRTGGHGRTPSRLSTTASSSAVGTSSAHPLSAPPMSRDDSTMEVEGDSLLSLAADTGMTGAGLGTASVAASSGHGEPAFTAKGHPAKQPTSLVEASGNEELSAAELYNVRARKEVREHIIAGRIRQAIDLLNRQFPSVLSPSLHTGEIGDANVQAAAAHSLRAVEGGKDKPPVETPERILPANPTSLDPAHLSLNLQIQAFIESVRAASTSTSTSPVATSATIPGIANYQGAAAMPSMHSIVSNTPGIAAAAISRSASPAPSSSSSTGSVTSGNGMSASAHSNGGGSSNLANPILHNALRHAQNLYREVQNLPAYWRAMYMKELESITTMLAYTDLERSPVRKYLDQSRRVALAEQINSAIMLRTGKPSQPLIESAVRQTTFCWSTLAHEKVVLPANHWVLTSGGVVGIDGFDGAAAGSSTAIAVPNTASSTAKNGGGKGKVVPSWDLHSFLQER